MASLAIELPEQDEQTEFNLRRWEEVLRDAELRRFEGRVETDRHGRALVSPPAAFGHGRRQALLGILLELHLPGGRVTVECPISTRDGVRAADVIWISHERLAEIGEGACLRRAPEICVEVLSPDNSRREMAEKKALYFAAGAEEVWVCDLHGRLTFFVDATGPAAAHSVRCPAFPLAVD